MAKCAATLDLFAGQAPDLGTDALVIEFGLRFRVDAVTASLELPSGRWRVLCQRREWEELVAPVLRRGIPHHWVRELLHAHGFHELARALAAVGAAAWRGAAGASAAFPHSEPNSHTE